MLLLLSGLALSTADASVISMCNATLRAEYNAHAACQCAFGGEAVWYAGVDEAPAVPIASSTSCFDLVTRIGDISTSGGWDSSYPLADYEADATAVLGALAGHWAGVRGYGFDTGANTFMSSGGEEEPGKYDPSIVIPGGLMDEVEDSETHELECRVDGGGLDLMSAGSFRREGAPESDWLFAMSNGDVWLMRWDAFEEIVHPPQSLP